MHRMLACLLTCSLCLLTGCWDRREINDVAFVAATGIDKKKDQFEVTVQIPLPGKMGGIGNSGGGGGTQGGPWYNETASAGTLREANEKQQSSMSRQLYFAHRRVVLLGEELAKSDIRIVLDVLSRVPQNRLTALPIVVKGKIEEVMGVNAPMEQFPAEMIREIGQTSTKRPVTLKTLAQYLLLDGQDVILPYITKAEGSAGESGGPQSVVRMEGFAVFRGGKLAGFVKDEEAEALLWATGQINNPNVQIPAPAGKGKIVMLFPQTTRKLVPRVRGDEITMSLNIKASGIVVENESNYYLVAQDNLHLVERQVEAQLKKQITQTVRKLQHTYKSDVLGFGDSLYRYYPEVWKGLRGAWNNHYYPKVKVVVDVSVHIEHPGSILRPMGIPKGMLKQ